MKGRSRPIFSSLLIDFNRFHQNFRVQISFRSAFGAMERGRGGHERDLAGVRCLLGAKIPLEWMLLVPMKCFFKALGRV